jgi:uridine kinase
MNVAPIIKKIDALSGSMHHPVIFIAGLGASGKTTLCAQLQNHFPDSVVIASDWFLSDSSKLRKEKIARGETPENPMHWYDWNGLILCVNTLQHNKIYHVENGWNQATGEKDFDCTIKIDRKKFAPIFVDGIYLLHPEINKHADLIVLMDAPLETLIQRRQARDGHRSSPEYLAQKTEWARKYDIPYFEAYRNRADITLKTP